MVENVVSYDVARIESAARAERAAMIRSWGRHMSRRARGALHGLAVALHLPHAA